MNQNKLIEHFERNMEKVKQLHRNDTNSALLNEKSNGYIAYAEKQLEAAKQGGIEALKKIWNS